MKIQQLNLKKYIISFIIIIFFFFFFNEFTHTLCKSPKKNNDSLKVINTVSEH